MFTIVKAIDKSTFAISSTRTDERHRENGMK